MKKVLSSIAVGLVIVVGLAFLFRDSLFGYLGERLTEDMFVAADTDGFDPGLPIGSPFPPIEARYRGETVRDLSTFIGDKGMIFVANRSADW